VDKETMEVVDLWRRNDMGKIP